MKRVRLLAVLLLFAMLFSACGEKMYDVVLYCTWDEVMHSGTAFRVKGLYGKSPEELSTRERVWENTGTGFYSYLETDLYLFFREGPGVPFVYDKGSGNIAFACRDSLCSHNDCIWVRAGTQVYAGGDMLFFYVKDEATIYVGDKYGENLRALYTSKGSFFSSLSRVGDYLYVLEDKQVVEEADDWIRSACQWIRIPVNGGEPELLEDVAQFSVNFLPTDQFYLYYRDGRYVVYDRRAKSGFTLPENAYAKALYGEWLYYMELIGDWEPGKPSTLCRVSVTDGSVRESLFTCTEDMTLLFSEEQIYILEKTPYSRSYDFGTYYEWKLYTADLQGKNKLLRMTFETDGIPDRIEELRVDGNLLYLRYRSYLDFQNEFCPVGSTGETHTMLVDLSDGRRILFGKEKGGV